MFGYLKDASVWSEDVFIPMLIGAAEQEFFCSYSQISAKDDKPPVNRVDHCATEKENADAGGELDRR